jgi:hypothetical protein
MMIVSVAVVTDSTAHSPANLAERNGVRQVPLHVLVDDRHRLNGVQFGSVALVGALARRASVTTSRPTPGEFEGLGFMALAAAAVGAGNGDVNTVCDTAARVGGPYASVLLRGQPRLFAPWRHDRSGDCPAGHRPVGSNRRCTSIPAALFRWRRYVPVRERGRGWSSW